VPKGAGKGVFNLYTIINWENNFFLVRNFPPLKRGSRLLVPLPGFLLPPWILGKEFGIDPVHLGLIFLANLKLGFLTPPVGMNLFLSSYRFNKPMSEVVRSVLPLLAILLFGILTITYFPGITTLLVHILG
jgi:C4-dicarboxylate transporter DctM subunit